MSSKLKIQAFKALLSGIFWIAVLFYSEKLTAQGIELSELTSGTEFFTSYSEPIKNLRLPLGPPYDWDTSVYTSLYIIGANESCVAIDAPGLGFHRTIKVHKGEVRKVRLPYNSFTELETVQKRGVSIRSTRPVCIIQCTNEGKGGGIDNTASINIKMVEASAIIPTNKYSKFEGAYPISSGSPYLYNRDAMSGSNYSIISAEDSNLIEVYFYSGTSKPYTSMATSIPPLTYQSYWLNKLDVIYFSTLPITGGFDHKNRFFVRSLNEKIFKLHKYPTDLRVNNQDGLSTFTFEEIAPGFSSSARVFHTPPLQGQAGNLLSIYSLLDSNLLKINGRTYFLDSLESFDTCIAEPAIIESEGYIYLNIAPCLNKDTNNTAQSPFSIGMNSSQNLIKKTIFRTFNEPDTTNIYIVSIVARTSNLSDLRLDGQPLDISMFSAFSLDPDWSWINLEVDTGIHTLEGDSGFLAYHYTYQSVHSGLNFTFPSYGYTLPEVVEWPLDSLSFKVGLSNSTLTEFFNFNDTLCPGQEIFFDPGSSRNITWEWSFGDGVNLFQRIDSQKAKWITHSWDQPGRYWVVVRDSLNCLVGDSIEIFVRSFPSINYSISQEQSCQGWLITIDNNSFGANSYHWVWPGGSSTAYSPQFYYDGQASSIPMELIFNYGHCVDSIIDTIGLGTVGQGNVVVPNVVTPNNDGINDNLCLGELGEYSECFEFSVFNRWGRLVFNTEHEADCWDPQGLSEGVYFFILKINGQELKGSINIFY